MCVFKRLQFDCSHKRMMVVTFCDKYKSSHKLCTPKESYVEFAERDCRKYQRGSARTGSFQSKFTNYEQRNVAVNDSRRRTRQGNTEITTKTKKENGWIWLTTVQQIRIKIKLLLFPLRY